MFPLIRKTFYVSPVYNILKKNYFLAGNYVKVIIYLYKIKFDYFILNHCI